MCKYTFRIALLSAIFGVNYIVSLPLPLSGVQYHIIHSYNNQKFSGFAFVFENDLKTY